MVLDGETLRVVVSRAFSVVVVSMWTSVHMISSDVVTGDGDVCTGVSLTAFVGLAFGCMLLLFASINSMFPVVSAL